jgi:hypothetical protein
MRRYLLGAVVLAAVAMVVTALPALSADSGTVAVSVTAQAPAAPCLTVTPDSVDFGTLPFSTSTRSSAGSQNITADFCGTAAGQNLLASTTDAMGAAGSWTPRASSGSPLAPLCPATNQFYLLLAGGSTGPPLVLTGTTAPFLTDAGSAAVFPGGNKLLQLDLEMPCQGSSGAGETKTLTATFTAVVP